MGDGLGGQGRGPRRRVQGRGARVEIVEEVGVELVLLGVREAAVRGVGALLFVADGRGDGAGLEEGDGDAPCGELQAQGVVQGLERVLGGGVGTLYMWGCVVCWLTGGRLKNPLAQHGVHRAAGS